tara:strand:+ start:782 stop:1027 length:246 start_codon:yes stop_codon:yes gene_type:complete
MDKNKNIKSLTLDEKNEFINELIDADYIESWKDLYEEISSCGLTDSDAISIIKMIILSDSAQSMFKSKFKLFKRFSNFKNI